MHFFWLEENSDQVKHYLMNFGENPPKKQNEKKRNVSTDRQKNTSDEFLGHINGCWVKLHSKIRKTE